MNSTKVRIIGLVLSALAIGQAAQAMDVTNKKILGKKLLLMAAQNNKAEEVIKLLEQGADINVQDEDSWSPLYVACFHNYPEIVKLLIAQGADINVRDSAGLDFFVRSLFLWLPRNSQTAYCAWSRH